MGIEVFAEKRPRVLVMWPHPRRKRVWESLHDSAAYEAADAFTYLPDNGFGFATLDPCRYPWNPLARHGSALAGIDPLRFLKLLVNYHRFDAVISMDSSSGLLFGILKRLLGLRKPLVIVDPALTTTYRLRQRIHDLALPAADAVVVFGSVQKQFLEDSYGEKVRSRFVRHRIDTRFFDAARVLEPAPAEPYVIAVGDDAGRDYRTLLAAAEGLGVRVLIKSSQPMPAPLPTNVEVLSNRISFEELRALYHHARLVVLPLHSTLHASGINTLLESMAMSKPVIVSNSIGISDYVEHGRNAWLVEPGEAAAMRTSIATLLEQPALSAELGRNARQFTLQQCSMPFYMRQLAGILASSMESLRP